MKIFTLAIILLASSCKKYGLDIAPPECINTAAHDECIDEKATLPEKEKPDAVPKEKEITDGEEKVLKITN